MLEIKENTILTHKWLLKNNIRKYNELFFIFLKYNYI